MLGIPFLSNYIKNIVKEQPVADSADWLNYYCTSIMLAFFSLAISAKQYFGSAIKCWTPNEFRGGWDKYAENYCFIANTYYVPYDEEVPTDLELRTDRISYYRWVPIMLAIQALLFWLPNWLWNMLHKQTAVNPRAIVNEARRSCGSIGAERDKEIEGLASYMADVLSVFHYRKGQKGLPRSGFNATVLYLSIKLLYVLNVIGQLILLNQFLGGEYFSWGLDQFQGIMHGEEWKESEIFPRVIMCDFVVRRLGNPQRHTIQCVVMMNMINEKLYFFLYFWLIFVGATTFINFFYYLTTLSIPCFRTKFVLLNINRNEQKMRGVRGRDLNRFVQKFLRPDGVLLLQFIRQHIGGRVTYDLLNELLRLYWIKECQRNDDDNTTTTKSSPISDKTPRGINYGGNVIHQRHLPSNVLTYKASPYGPSSLYPIGVTADHFHGNQNELPMKKALTAEDFIDSAPASESTPHKDYSQPKYSVIQPTKTRPLTPPPHRKSNGHAPHQTGFDVNSTNSTPRSPLANATNLILNSPRINGHHLQAPVSGERFNQSQHRPQPPVPLPKPKSNHSSV